MYMSRVAEKHGDLCSGENGRRKWSAVERDPGHFRYPPAVISLLDIFGRGLFAVGGSTAEWRTTCKNITI